MIVSGAELVVAGLGVDIEGRHIVQDVDFVAHPGQVVGILGPNGSGDDAALNLPLETPYEGDGDRRWCRCLGARHEVVLPAHFGGSPRDSRGVPADVRGNRPDGEDTSQEVVAVAERGRPCPVRRSHGAYGGWRSRDVDILTDFWRRTAAGDNREGAGAADRPADHG